MVFSLAVNVVSLIVKPYIKRFKIMLGEIFEDYSRLLQAPNLGYMMYLNKPCYLITIMLLICISINLYGQVVIENKRNIYVIGEKKDTLGTIKKNVFFNKYEYFISNNKLYVLSGIIDMISDNYICIFEVYKINRYVEIESSISNTKLKIPFNSHFYCNIIKGSLVFKCKGSEMLKVRLTKKQI